MAVEKNLRVAINFGIKNVLKKFVPVVYILEKTFFLQLLLLKIFECFLQKQPLEVFYKKGVLKNFAKFIGKHLCQSLFFNKVAGLPFKQSTSGRQFLFLFRQNKKLVVYFGLCEPSLDFQ